jgi:methionine synthase II (cobalamin-independent)
MIPKIIGSSKIEGFFVNKYRYIQSKDLTSFFRQFLGIIEGAFMESYANVLNNSYLSDEQIVKVIQRVYKDEFYNLKTHKFEKLKETTVINSVDTDIQILRSVISIVGILATSNQFITLNFNTRDQVR